MQDMVYFEVIAIIGHFFFNSHSLPPYYSVIGTLCGNDKNVIKEMKNVIKKHRNKKKENGDILLFPISVQA